MWQTGWENQSVFSLGLDDLSQFLLLIQYSCTAVINTGKAELQGAAQGYIAVLVFYCEPWYPYFPAVFGFKLLNTFKQVRSPFKKMCYILLISFFLTS